MSANEKTPRTVKRVVTMRNLTPDVAAGGSGYRLSGNTDAEIMVCPDGIRIRAKGRRGEGWRLQPWDEIWINAHKET